VFRAEEEEKVVGMAFIGSIFPENGIEQLISEAKKNPKSPGF
jgi:effector-binding domain-containing protein